MATFWEKAVYSVNHMLFPELCLFVDWVVSHFGFEGGTVILIAALPDHGLHFTFYYSSNVLSKTMRFAVFASLSGPRDAKQRTL